MIKVTLNNEILNYITEIDKNRFNVSSVELPVSVADRLRKNSKKKSSYASNKIEGNPLSEKQADEVIEQDSHKHLLQPEQEIRNYFLALNLLEEKASKREKISRKLILDVQKCVEKGASKEKIGLRGDTPPGVLFAVYDSETGNADYVPPAACDVPGLLDELIEYVNTTDDHPLIVAAVVHYQLVTIHPFEDGNGRTARLISGYILDINGYGFNGIGSLEEYFAYDIHEYYDSLQMGLPVIYYNGRINPPHPEIWITYFLRMVKLYSDKVCELSNNSCRDLVCSSLSYLKTREKELLLFLINSGYTDFTPIDISRQLGVTNKTIINRLFNLIKNGFIVPVMVKERIRSYKLSDFTLSNKTAICNHINNELNNRMIGNKTFDFIVGKNKASGDTNKDSSVTLLEELIIEGYSGEKLLSEFKHRHSQLKQGIDAILNDAKNAYKNSGFGEEIPYEVIPESKDQNYKRNIWDAAIGLQAVDGLKPSDYLRKLADENIAGKKTYEEIDLDLKKEYGSAKSHQQEADTVSLRIAQMLEYSEFSMTTEFLIMIHSSLFDDVLEPVIAGKFRKYNIRKREPILLGDSVQYSNYLLIKSQLAIILEEEKEYKYSQPLTDEDINHLSEFTRKIWQTHPFGEGNTRTTAVFIELYLKSLGYEVNNIPFKNNSDYYRNALVRSCYSSETYDVKPTCEYLNRFYMNLLSGTDYSLDSFDLFISNKE